MISPARTALSAILPSQEDTILGRRRNQRRGWLRKKGPSWLFDWRDYLRDERLGKLVAVRRSEVIAEAEGPERKTKGEARDIADEILEDVSRRSARPGTMMSVEQFVTSKFEPQVLWKKKPAGREHYAYCFSKLLNTCDSCGKRIPKTEAGKPERKLSEKEQKLEKQRTCSCTIPRPPAFARRRMCDVTTEHVEDVIRTMHDRGYSDQTLLHFVHAISAIFRHAKRLRMYGDENPAAGMGKEMGEVRHKKRPTYTWEQAQKVIARLRNPYRLMALVSVATSMNVAEICGLRRKWANVGAQVATVEGEVLAPHSLAVRENYYRSQYGSLKEGSRKRNVAITPELAAEIAILMRGAKNQDPEAPVFQSSTGTPVDAHNVLSRTFKKLEKDLGFPVTWHAFRRAHSSFAGQLDGVSVEDRVATMGHADASMTLYYSVEDVERRRAIPAKILEKLMGTVAGGVQ